MKASHTKGLPEYAKMKRFLMILNWQFHIHTYTRPQTQWARHKYIKESDCTYIVSKLYVKVILYINLKSFCKKPFGAATVNITVYLNPWLQFWLV